MYLQTGANNAILVCKRGRSKGQEGLHQRRVLNQDLLKAVTWQAEDLIGSQNKNKACLNQHGIDNCTATSRWYYSLLEKRTLLLYLTNKHFFYFFK